MSMKSILQQDKRCFFCGSTVGLEEHHIFGGVANRKISEKYGLKINVCAYHHRDPKNGVQYNKELNQRVKSLAQIAFEARHSHEEWMQIIKKNYL